MYNKTIKILYLIDELDPGGTENQLVLLAEGLSRKYFEPTIGVLRASEYQSRLQLKTQIIDFNWKGAPVIKNVTLLFRLRRFFQQNKFDIIQTHFQEAAIYGHLATKLLYHKAVLIGTRRNLYHWIDEEPWNFRFYKRTTRWIDMIIANSSAALELCQKLEGVPEKKITLIPNGIEIERFLQVYPDQFKNKMKLNGSFPIIGVVANWRPVKGLTVFLQAASTIHKKFPKAYFILAGKGDQKRELETFAITLDLNDRVQFVEDPINIPEIINSFDIAVQPSLSESFSNVLLEYMVAGKPVVATKVGDAEIIFENGKDGVLVKPDNHQELSNAIINLLSDWKYAKALGKNGQKKAILNWSLATTIEKYQNLYYNLLNHKTDNSINE